MITADDVPTASKAMPATGNTCKVSRRGALVLAAMMPAAAALPAAAVVSQTDAAFWQALREYRAMEAAHEADTDESDEALNRGAAKLRRAETALMCMRVKTLQAVAAKLNVVREHNPDGALLGKPFTRLDVISWDMERLVKAEMFA